MVLDGLSLSVESVILEAGWELALGVRKALLDGLAGDWGAERCRSTENGARSEHREVVRCNWAAITVYSEC